MILFYFLLLWGLLFIFGKKKSAYSMPNTLFILFFFSPAEMNTRV